MALTPSSVRADLKCGKGSISQGEKCTKGASSRVRGALETAAIVGGTAGTLVSYGQAVHQAMKGNVVGASKALQREGAFAALSGAGMAAKGARTGNTALRQKGTRAIATGALMAGGAHVLGGGYTKGMRIKPSSIRNIRIRLARGRASVAAQASILKSRVTQHQKRAELERMFKQPGRRDSIWAVGFEP